MDCPKYADLVGAVKKLKLVGAILPTVQVKILFFLSVGTVNLTFLLYFCL